MSARNVGETMKEGFTCDHISLKKGEMPFFPKICYDKTNDPLSSFNVVTLSLDASLSSNLSWNAIKKEAKDYIERGKTLFWKMNFSLEEVSLLKKGPLSSFLLAIQHFTEELFFPFSNETLGVCLYQGSPLNHFKWNVEHEEIFSNWKPHYSAFPSLKNLYQIKVLSDYLHHLAAALPDEALPFALFTPPPMSSAYLAQLLSRETFPYLYIGLINHELPLAPLNQESSEAKVGLTLPLHSFCSEKSIREVDGCMKELKKRKIPFRVIAESHLTECWDELDELILFPEYLSPQGKRKAQGFMAAGGDLISWGARMLNPSISKEEFLNPH